MTRVVKKINGHLLFLWISKMNRSYDAVECGMLHQRPIQDQGIFIIDTTEVAFVTSFCREGGTQFTLAPSPFHMGHIKSKTTSLNRECNDSK